ncbi:MAG: hypothetical protein L0Z53_04750 [Acidobacteriales bacterium]|nr:hypothetical protein [Terriglobales bacterium]
MKKLATVAWLLVLLGCAKKPQSQESYNVVAAMRAYNDFLARTLVEFESLHTEEERTEFARRLKSDLEVETLRYRRHVDGEKARGTLLQTSRTPEFRSETQRLQTLANRVGVILDKYLFAKKETSYP